jgi:hypothetical protein
MLCRMMKKLYSHTAAAEVVYSSIPAAAKNADEYTQSAIQSMSSGACTGALCSARVSFRHCSYSSSEVVHRPIVWWLLLSSGRPSTSGGLLGRLAVLRSKKM